MKKTLIILVIIVIAMVGIGGYFASQKYLFPKTQTVGVYSAKPSIKITSPNIGQILIKGSTYNITWESNGLQRTDKIRIILSDILTTPGFINQALQSVSQSSYFLVANLNGDSTSYNWIIPKNINSGNVYKLKIDAYRNSPSTLASDLSEDFSIVDSQ